MSAFDYKALAERVAQRAIYADNNADPNNKAWAADLRAVVSLLNGMADAQPAAPHYAMLDSHRRQVEQAIQSAEHPSGMSTHDGKARIDASILRRMLAIIDSLPAAPKEENNVWKQIIPDDAPQAEPKREPLSDERIAEIQRAAYERAAKECLATAAELRRCSDGCTDGRYDWKADGAEDCADAIRALGGQHD